MIFLLKKYKNKEMCSSCLSLLLFRLKKTGLGMPDCQNFNYICLDI